MEPQSASRATNAVGWLGVAIAGLTLISAFVVPEVRKAFDLQDHPVQVQVELAPPALAPETERAPAVAAPKPVPADVPETGGPVDEAPAVAEPAVPAPPQTDTFAAQLNDILQQADPQVMLRRLNMDERDLLTMGGVVERIDSQQIVVRDASGRHIPFTYDSSTVVHSDAARISGDQVSVGDRVYVQWFRRPDGARLLHTITVTHIF